MSLKAAHELKHLESRLQKLKVELSERDAARKEAQAAYASVHSKIQAVEQSIANLKATATKPVVTEHALLRYLERVKGVDLQAIRDEILTSRTIQAIDTLQTCKLPFGEGMLLVVEKRAVTSVVPVEDRHQAQARETAAAKHRGPKPAQLRRQQAEDGGSVDQSAFPG
ncbi:hypothetical protein F6X40_10085 [Paraburkholderia sp. UCT31]|uniref:hypothetical protein n=1 Tax=Paraburkholderia sp. UCT31 TaxID=2615209 RepID=UPI001655E6EB|nr:hypothetical protein [Paraburkholderia sp. UCT31]MBC8737156.1 hypothetical protein [Paraburkholderia sp. UCT31]